VKASPLILSLCAALVALAGCKTPCESVCSEFNDCSIAARDHKVDCRTYCEREEQFEEKAEETGADACATQFDEHISCWESNIDGICNAENTACEASATAWTDCVAKFCGEPKELTEPQQCQMCLDTACCKKSGDFQEQCAACPMDADPVTCTKMSCGLTFVNDNDPACVPQEEGPPLPALTGF
jgi:hypothetical protein